MSDGGPTGVRRSDGTRGSIDHRDQADRLLFPAMLPGTAGICARSLGETDSYACPHEWVQQSRLTRGRIKFAMFARLLLCSPETAGLPRGFVSGPQST